MMRGIDKEKVHKHVRCRRPKAEYVVDFENLAELPPGTFKLAPHKDISLKATSAVNTLLPPDHHYKVRSCPHCLFASSGCFDVCFKSAFCLAARLGCKPVQRTVLSPHRRLCLTVTVYTRLHQTTHCFCYLLFKLEASKSIGFNG